MPAVSVIIPSYNHEKYIEECIQSVLDQTFQDFEIVIVDDGSTDGTVEKIKQFSDPRIRFFPFETNRGACTAANRCVQEARGEYIAMLSSDDIFLKHKLEKQVDFLEKHREIPVVFGYAQIIGEDGENFNDENHPYYLIFQQANRSRQDWLRRFFFIGNCLCHPSALIRRELYSEIGLYDERMANLPDFDFWVRTCLQHEIHILPEPLIKFRVRAGDANASGDKHETHIRAGFEISEVLRHYLDISSLDDFIQIFPEMSGKAIDPELLPFHLAKLAFDVGHSAYKHFGITVLFELLKDQRLAERLKETQDFSHRDLIRLTGTHDVFRLQELDEVAKERDAARKYINSINRNWIWKVVKRIFNLKEEPACRG